MKESSWTVKYEGLVGRGISEVRRCERWFGVKVWWRSSAAKSMLKGECFCRMEFISGGME